MTEARLAYALESCITAVRRGRSAEAALRFYPDLRPELDSLLVTALHLPSIAVPEFAGCSRRRAELMEAIRPRDSRAPALLPFLPLRRLRLAFAPAFVAVLTAAVLLGYVAFNLGGQTEASTVLTVLSGEVTIETKNGSVAGKDGMSLSAGDRVITGPDARAVLTFSDGSTVTLAGDAVVALRSVEETAGRLHVALSQPQGSTWTYTPDRVGAADVEIETPSARVQTRDASVETTVRFGQTEVGAQSGAISVQSQTTARTEIPNGFRASVDTPGQVAAPQPALKPTRELVLRIQGPVYAYLTDPGSSTVGTIAPGVPINQVSGAWVEQFGDTTLLHLPDPADGSYKLALNATAEGAVSVTAILRNGSTDQTSTALSLKRGESLNLGFELEADDVNLVASSNEQPTAKVVVPAGAVQKANAVQTATVIPSPTRTATPEPTSTPSPQPTSTPTPRPAITPKPAPAPIESELAQPSSLDSDSASPR